jgi:hypothetical protein
VNKEQTNEKLFQDEGNDKCFHCREMIVKFIQTRPHIRTMSFIEVQNGDGGSVRTGDITFSVFMDDMGFDKSTYLRYEKEFFSNFMINFFGEFLVRENISKFVELSSTVNSQDFIQAISSQIHKKFGITVQGNVVTFTFHISLLPKILTEDLRALDW